MNKAELIFMLSAFLLGVGLGLIALLALEVMR